jgi:hypothetical protein
MATTTATTTNTSTETVWHRYSEPREAFGYAFPPAPSVSWWLPTITVHKWLSDGKAVPVWAPTTLTCWEADDYIRRAQRAGYSVDAWDSTPTCLSQQRYACGPCTPLTCAVGRPLRGAGPRYR